MPGLGNVLVELAGVQASRAQPEQEAGPAGHQRRPGGPVRAARGQGLAQPGDVPMQPGSCVHRRPVTPDPGDELAAADRVPGPGGQHAEHGAPPRGADPEFPLPPPGPDRAQQFKP